MTWLDKWRESRFRNARRHDPVYVEMLHVVIQTAYRDEPWYGGRHAGSANVTVRELQGFLRMRGMEFHLCNLGGVLRNLEAVFPENVREVVDGIYEVQG